MRFYSIAVYILLLFLFFDNPAVAQKKKEIKYSGFFDSYYFPGPYNITIGAGAAMYNGDLCGSPGCNNFNLGLNAGMNYRILPRIYVGGQFQYLTLGATDKNKSRNLTFKSSIIELTPYGRYYFIDDIVRTARDRSNKPKVIKPFFSLGLSFIYILSAKSSYASDTVSLPLPIEAAGSKIAFGIPAGIGIAFYINPYISIVPELTYNYTFTDNLDNVSEIRGNPAIKDGYAMFNVKLQFTPSPYIKKKKNTYGGTKSGSSGSSGELGSSGNDSTASPKKDVKDLPQENKEKVDEQLIETPNNSAPAEIKEETPAEPPADEKEKEEKK